MSCLFNSMSFFFNKSGFEIRKIICDYLEQNKPIIDGLDTKFILEMENPNYIQNMRNINTWGGAIEIQTACNIWNTKIIVHNIRDSNQKIEFIPSYNNNINNRKIDISWNGNHYEPIKIFK